MGEECSTVKKWIHFCGKT